MQVQKTKWKRYVAFGCSHGADIDPEAREAVLKFIDHWKPERRIHLGDAVDLASLRSGAQANSDCSDRAVTIGDDVDSGVDFLTTARVTDYLMGNHEDRIFRFLNSPNALKARAAQAIYEDLQNAARLLKAKMYPYHNRSYVELGDTKFLHGFLYNVSAIRDTAETYGRCVMAHIHRTGIEQARTLDGGDRLRGGNADAVWRGIRRHSPPLAGLETGLCLRRIQRPPLYCQCGRTLCGATLEAAAVSKKIDEAWSAFSKSRETHDHGQLLKEGWKSVYDLEGSRPTLMARLTADPRFENKIFKVSRSGQIRDIRFFRPITQ